MTISDSMFAILGRGCGFEPARRQCQGHVLKQETPPKVRAIHGATSGELIKALQKVALLLYKVEIKIGIG